MIRLTYLSFKTRLNWQVHTLTFTLTANGRLIVGNTFLFQILVERPAIRHQCQAKQGLPIAYIKFCF